MIAYLTKRDEDKNQSPQEEEEEGDDGSVISVSNG